MTNRSVNQYRKPINNPALSEILLKLEALSHMTLTHDFLSSSPSIQHDYLWMMNELIGTARQLSEHNNL